jgi:hypothetical protein
MFAVIYRAYIKPGLESQYQEYWKKVASYFVSHRGALGSTLHKGEDGLWIAYSRWPDKATRDAAWPAEGEKVNPEIPSEMQEAIKGIKQCLDMERKLPDICMEIVESIPN